MTNFYFQCGEECGSQRNFCFDLSNSAPNLICGNKATFYHTAYNLATQFYHFLNMCALYNIRWHVDKANSLCL